MSTEQAPAFKPIPCSILCLDFDGVIHRYSKGWQDGEIYDPLTDGFIAWAYVARDYFRLVIYSSRSKTAEGLMAMQSYLRDQLALSNQLCDDPVTVDDFEFAHEKPPAFLTIDDRGLTFTGSWEQFPPDKLRAFKPWNQMQGDL